MRFLNMLWLNWFFAEYFEIQHTVTNVFSDRVIEAVDCYGCDEQQGDFNPDVATLRLLCCQHSGCEKQRIAWEEKNHNQDGFYKNNKRQNGVITIDVICQKYRQRHIYMQNKIN